MGKLPSSDELKKQIMGTILVAWRNNLELPIIERWLDNFTGEALGDADHEKNLALWLLYNFTYYNEEEVKHLCRLLLRKYLHAYLKEGVVGEQEINDVLKESTFFPLGRNSESGAYVLYLFRQENDLPLGFFDNGQEISESSRIVFVDDMTLSGSQAKRNISRIKYGDYKIKGEHISDKFMELLLTDTENGLRNEIITKITCDRSDKAKVTKMLNSKIIENVDFYDEIHKKEDVVHGNPILSDLLRRYTTDRENMAKVAIYKMNRLILEETFSDMIVKSRKIVSNNKIVLLTFIASEKAKKCLAAENIQIINCIDLDEMSAAFSEKSMALSAYHEERCLCKHMCEYYGKKIKESMPLGYDDCQYLLGLYYTIPNNTLPIFWGNKNWNPLFVRHEKNYGGNTDVGGKFI